MAKIMPLKYSDLMGPIGGVDEYHDAASLAVSRVQAASNVYAKDGSLYKRPGRRLWGPSFDTSLAFHGVKEYVDSDGTVRLIVAHGHDVYNVTSAAATSLDDITDEQDLHFHSLRGKLFYNGSSKQRKLDGATASAVGLAAPSAACVAAVSGAGTLNGSYAYKITYVINSVAGVEEYESDPSAVSNSVSPSTQGVALSSVPVSSDSRVNARNVYRTTASGSKYFYVGQIGDNTTTAYTDDGTVSDAEIGAEVEYTHAQPTQAEYACGCNDRQFWLKGDTLYYSEAAQTVAYLEYAKSTNFWKLPGTGAGIGLKALYNTTTAREDLYVFQSDAISILPGGDPLTALVVLSNGFGGYHDTIVDYKGALVFLSTNGIVYALMGGRLLDISTRNIPVSMASALHRDGCRAAVIFDNFYALTIEYDGGKLYNHRTWVCDLRTLSEAGSNAADAVWFPWEVDADYWIQRKDGTVLALDNNSRRIYVYATQYSTDETAAGSTYTNIDAWIWTPNFMMKLPMAMKRPYRLALNGTFHKQLTITPYLWKTTADTAVTYSPIETAFIMGTSTVGTAGVLTRVNRLQEVTLPVGVVGNMFSFKIESKYDDLFFELVSYQFTYKLFGRGLA